MQSCQVLNLVQLPRPPSFFFIFHGNITSYIHRHSQDPNHFVLQYSNKDLHRPLLKTLFLSCRPSPLIFLIYFYNQCRKKQKPIVI